MKSTSIALLSVLIASVGSGCASTTEAKTATRDTGTTAPAAARAAQREAAQAAASLAFHPEVVHFGYDESQLDETGMARLQALAGHLKSSPSTKVRIVGHADERGTPEYNLSLGDARARVARDYLVRLGISAERVIMSSRGEEEPAVQGTGEAAWAQNRRDEMTLLEEVATR